MNLRSFYDKIIENIISKTINCGIDNSILQPETQPSQSGFSQKLSAYAYMKEEEQTFIHSEIKNEEASAFLANKGLFTVETR